MTDDPNPATSVEACVDALILDLSDRRGLDDAWGDIDEEIRQEIRDEWREIVRAHLTTPEVLQNVADQLAAAGAIVARLTSLLQQPRPHDAPLPYLPNEVPAALQVPTVQLLQAVGLDMHGRPVEAK